MCKRAGPTMTPETPPTTMPETPPTAAPETPPTAALGPETPPPTVPAPGFGRSRRSLAAAWALTPATVLLTPQ